MRTYTLSNITANHSVQVTFIQTYTITISESSGGYVSPYGNQTVQAGTNFSLTATPNGGYVVATWSVDGTVAQQGGNSFTLTNVSANHTVAVSFAVWAYINPSAGANRWISPNTTQYLAPGNSITLTATPNTGYEAYQWSVNSTVVQTYGATFTFTPSAAMGYAVKVTFATATYYTITPGAGANGAISPNTAQSELAGSNLTFTATPNSGYMVNTWTLDGSTVQTGGTT